MQENFPDRVIYAESSKSDAVKKEELLNLIKIQNINSFRKTSGISSHNFNNSCYGLAKNAFTILRLPHKRNWSAYNFHKLQHNEDNSLSYSEYLKINSNFQLKSLSRGLVLEEKRITEILNNFQIGILERFDESMICLEVNFEKQGIFIDLSYPNNLNSQKYKGKDNQIDKTLENHSEKDKEFKDFYNLDYILYNKANKKLDIEIDGIKDFEKRMSDFKFRCEKLKEISYKGKRKLYGQGPISFNYVD